MRLIDADDVITVFTNRLFETLKTQSPCVTATESKICLETCYKIARFEIDNIPTAYEVDKIVAELGTARSDYIDDENYDVAFGLKLAMEIVKGGE